MGVVSIGKTIIGSLFKKPSTLMYPVVPREWQERTRGAVGIDVDRCILCGACGRACPTGAISTDRKGRTWSIERMNCIQCGACIENCPPKCLEMLQQYTEPGAEKVVDSFYVEKKAPKKPAKKAEPAKAEEPEKKPEPAKAEEPVKETEPAKTEEPVKAEEPAKKPEVTEAQKPEKVPAEAPEAEAAAGADEAKTAEAADTEKAPEPAKEASKKADPETEGYIAEVRASLINDFDLSESDAEAALEKSGLARQLTAFPYLMKRTAKEAAERMRNG